MATTNDRMKVTVEADDKITLPLKQIESSVIRFVGAVSASMAAFKALTFEITAASDLQKELLNVQKTTEFADETIGHLGDSLVELSKKVNVTATDLAKIAAVGGQLGLGSQGSAALLQFTDTASRMSSVLDVAVEDAANGIAKITNIFKIGLKDSERIASAFNELSNNSTASGAALLDVVQRIGDAGGTINLEQSLGLAATGVDFGLTLETIGTSFTKVFLDMQSKAAQFAQFMHMSTEDWTSILNHDGIGGLKLYLAELRKLDSAERARVAEQLTGGGRVFSLINKLTQDTNNVVLNKNLAFAKAGWDSATSAIEEQQTVLKGFDTQVQILKNHFVAIAETIGNTALPQVTSLVRRLQEWLDNPAVVDGVTRFAGFFADMAGAVINAARFVANLNVNWENMVRIGGMWLALNMVQHMLGWLGSLGAVRAAISAIDGTGLIAFKARAKEVTAQISSAWAAAKGLASSLAGVSIAAATRPLIPAADVTGRANATANLAAEAAAAKSHLQTLKLIAAQQLGVASLYANNLALSKAKEEAEAAANAKIIALTEERAAVQKLADTQDAITHEKALAAKQRADDVYAANAKFANAQIAADRARSAALATATTAQEVKSIQASYAAKVGVARKALATELQLAEDAFAARRGLMAQDLAAARTYYQQRVAIAAGAAEAEVVAATVVTEAAKARMLTMGGAIIALFKTLGTAISFLFKGFLWVSLIVSLLDMLGVLKPLTEWFFKLTDAIGLTDNATRKLQQATNIENALLEKKTKALEAQRAEYLKLAQAQGGLRQDVFDAQLEQAGGRKKEVAEVSVKNLADLANTRLAVFENNDVKESFAKEHSQLVTQIEEISGAMTDAIHHVEDLQKALDEMEKKDAGHTDIQIIARQKGLIEAAKKTVLGLQIELNNLQGQAAARGEAAAAKVVQQLTRLDQSAKDFASNIKRIFTDEMAALMVTAVEPFAQAAEELDATQKRVDEFRRGIAAAANDKNNKLVNVTGVDGNSITLPLEQAQTELTKLTNKVILLKARMAESKESIKAFAQATKDNASGNILLQILDKMSLPQIKDTIESLKTLFGTGQLKGDIPLNATKGSDTGGEKADLAAGDLALAQLRTFREITEGKIRLNKEMYAAELAEQDDFFRRGLVSLKSYYENRKVLIQQGLLEEIRLKEAEKKEAERAIENAGLVEPNQRAAQQEAARAQLERVNADLKVLRFRYSNAYREIDRDRIEEQERRNRESTQLEIQLAESIGDIRRAADLRGELEFRDMLTRNKTERERAEADLAQGIIEQNQEVIDDANRRLAQLTREVKVSITLRTLKQAEDDINAFIKQTSDKIRAGLINPEDVSGAVSAKVREMGPALAQEIEIINELLKDANSEAEKKSLEEWLGRATTKAAGLRDSLFEVNRQATEIFQRNLDIKIKLGLIGTTEAGEQIVAFARSQAAAMKRDLIDPLLELQRVQGASFSSENAARLQQLTLEFRGLNNTISQLATDINGQLRSAFTSLFADVAAGTKTMKQSWDDFGKSLRATAAQTLSSDLVDKFLGPMLEGTGSIGDIVSKTLNPGRQKGDTAANALWVRMADAGPFRDVLNSVSKSSGDVKDSLPAFDNGKVQTFPIRDQFIEVVNETTGAVEKVAVAVGDGIHDVFDTAETKFADGFDRLGNEVGGSTGISGFFDTVVGWFREGFAKLSNLFSSSPTPDAAGSGSSGASSGLNALASLATINASTKERQALGVVGKVFQGPQRGSTPMLPLYVFDVSKKTPGLGMSSGDGGGGGGGGMAPSSEGGLWEGLQQLVSDVYNGAKTVVTDTYSAAKEVAKNAYEGVTTVAKDTYSGVKSFVEDTYSGVKDVASSIWSGIERVGSAITDRVSSFFGGAPAATAEGAAGGSGFFGGLLPGKQQGLGGMLSTGAMTVTAQQVTVTQGLSDGLGGGTDAALGGGGPETSLLGTLPETMSAGFERVALSIENLTAVAQQTAAGLESVVAGIAQSNQLLAQIISAIQQMGSQISSQLSTMQSSNAAGTAAGGSGGVAGATSGAVDVGYGGTPAGGNYAPVTDVVATPASSYRNSASSAGDMVPQQKEEKGFLDSLLDGFTSMLDSLAQGFMDLFKGIFNSISSLFSGGSGGGDSGGGFFSMIASFFHTGGVVGGGSSKAVVNPMAFIGAPRYHTGGLPGLKSDEVAAVLQKGEEVLTASDPRHTKNGGRGTGGGSTNLNVGLNLGADALNVVMRDWLEGHLATIMANR